MSGRTAALFGRERRADAADVGARAAPPPYLSWWNATDDGRVYRGWDESRAQLAALAAQGPFGVLGFSQGGW